MTPKCWRCGQKKGRIGSTPDGRLYFGCSTCMFATPIPSDQFPEAPYDPKIAAFAKEWDARYAAYLESLKEKDDDQTTA